MFSFLKGMMAMVHDFGPNTPKVLEFIESLRQINWMHNIGIPHTEDYKVTRVYSWEDAKRAAENEITPKEDEIQREKLKKVAVESGRLVMAEEAVSLAALYATSFTEAYSNIRWAIAADKEGAIYEVVLGDLGDFHYYLDLIEWYRAGHWPCGHDGNGKLIVF